MRLPLFYCLTILSFSLGATGCKKEPGPEEEKPPIIKQTVTCENTCIFKNDGECDDGGRLSTSDFCAWGTDCKDCGERIVVEVIEQE